MNIKAKLRNTLNGILRMIPKCLHTALLKSYADMPDLTLGSNFRCYPQDFTSPLVNPADVDLEKLHGKRSLPGIDVNLEKIAAFIEPLSRYILELDWMERKADGKVAWHETYTTLDSAVLYSLLRHLKPRRFIEVGCGCSSLVSSEAIRNNRREGADCEVTFIEPYPGPRLDGIDLAGDLLVKKIEEVPIDYFSSLNEGDVLFIDTSHVIKCQNDVEYELLHILPSLKSGVYVHIHDIYTPYDQPKDWLLDRKYIGHANEQYAVECLLSGGDDFELLAPLYWLGKDHPELVADFLNGADDRGQAIWIKKNR